MQKKKLKNIFILFINFEIIKNSLNILFTLINMKNM